MSLTFNPIQSVLFTLGDRKFQIDSVWKAKDKCTIEFHEIEYPDKRIIRSKEVLEMSDVQFDGMNI